jgi:DNA-binding NtrC family response regulator
MDDELPVVMITAHGTVDNAVEALKTGAFDYITKPFDQAEVRSVVQKALRTRDLSATEATRAPEAVSQEGARYGIIGQSPGILQVYSVLDRVADTPTTVLITGESGTGKELVAAALHRLSDRQQAAFVEINCATIPDNLLESELFGFEKGAFTHAQSRKKGLFELAQEGTIFLDEIAEMPLHLQAKLLRFLEKRSLRRLGGTTDISINARIVAATNRDLREAVRLGTFREDLFYRLNVIPIHLPPLRERGEDILLLARHFLDLYSRRLGRPAKRLADEAQAAFLSYAWPGNIRELKNIIERLVILCPVPVITHGLLPPEMHRRPRSPGNGGTPGEGFDLEAHLNEIERHLVQAALERAQGRKCQAADDLGISRHALKRRLVRLGLATEDHDDD